MVECLLCGDFCCCPDERPDPPDVAQAAAYEEDIRIERLREMNDE